MTAPRAARAEADRQALETDTFVAEAMTRLDAVINDLLDTRWGPRDPKVVAAATRALARQQARLDAALLTAVHAIDTRDDVVPGARPGRAGAAFLRASLGLDTHRAGHQAALAELLQTGPAASSTGGDLAVVGAAYSAGDITRAHADIAARVHRRLGPPVRDAMMSVIDAETGEVVQRRCIDVVDETLADRARAFSVPEFARVADRIVENLNPPDPDAAHHRRYLHLSRLPDGSLTGRFACGPAQGLTLTAVIAALAAPRPGVAVDADGVEHVLPDERTAPERRMDALVEACEHNNPHLVRGKPSNRAGADGDDHDARDDDPRSYTRNEGEDHTCDDACHASDHDAGSAGSRNDQEGEGNADEELDLAQNEAGDLAQDGRDLAEDRGDLAEEPPPHEGELQIRRPPGVRTGPYPDVQIIVTATLDQLAHARCLDHPDRPLWHEPGTSSPVGDTGGAGVTCPSADGNPVGWVGFAHVQHAGAIHPRVLNLLACCGRIRGAVTDEHGAVLNLSRRVRLATPAQKAALYARDIGCVIPGCTVQGEFCEVHHVKAWAEGGPTDIANLTLLCRRHHVEVTDGTWEITMINGVPWARPPAWAHPARPLLRNASHTTRAGAA